ncbi:MAG TPA: biotin/lipoyl-binding protein, partial [Novosphingobium sp.]|nr:biotin/lipoyl-binding protein [Novosphingobium sp.]
MIDPANSHPAWNAARTVLRFAVTAALVVLALIAARALWDHYQSDPWTRDGRVRADVVQVAPDVPGLVTKINFTHDQMVHRGDVLFEIDRARYELALRQADDSVRKASAAVMRARATLGEARREAARNHALGDLVATEATEQSQTKVAEGE